jgi:mono/diheme cytochrome c family protein
MVPRYACQARALVAGLLICLSAASLLLPGASNAASTSQLSSRGKALLQQNCGRCHAIGARGRSPQKAATPMRTIYGRFAPLELQAELREGMVSRHRAMPQIDFSDEDVDAILAYLYALAIKR